MPASHTIILKSAGNSMLPLLHDHDVLYLKKVHKSSLQVNDFVGINRGKKIVIHRIIYLNKNYVITKGDNNLLTDGKVNIKKILGIVYKIKRGNKYFLPKDFYLLQSTVYFDALEIIRKSLVEKLVPFVILKGLPLYLFLEKKHPDRIYADCDILIDEQYSKKVDHILISLGYRHKKATPFPFLLHHDSGSIEVSYIKTVSTIPIVIDVHKNLVFMMARFHNSNLMYPQKNISRLSKEMVERKKEIVLFGSLYFILSLEDLIIYLALHLFHHNYRGSARFHMLHNTISMHVKEINVQLIATRIKQFKLENFTYPVFYLLNKYFDTPTVKNIADKTKPQKGILIYIKKYIIPADIFGNQTRMDGGAMRFKNLFMLSPMPLYIKTLALIHPQVIINVFVYIISKIKNKLGSS